MPKSLEILAGSAEPIDNMHEASRNRLSIPTRSYSAASRRAINLTMAVEGNIRVVLRRLRQT